jgi:hypothetical protein
MPQLKVGEKKFARESTRIYANLDKNRSNQSRMVFLLAKISED